MADEISGRVLELWRQYQSELAKHGITDYTMQPELEIWQVMRLAPSVDTLPEGKIHSLAYDHPRPDRPCRCN